MKHFVNYFSISFLLFHSTFASAKDTDSYQLGLNVESTVQPSTGRLNSQESGNPQTKLQNSNRIGVKGFPHQNIVSEKEKKSVFEKFQAVFSSKEHSMPIDEDFSTNLKSSLSFHKNDLLKFPYNWSAEIPYTEIVINYPFSENNLFKMEFDFSYQNKEWNYSIDCFSVHHQLLFYKPVNLQAGYFIYPVSYTNENITTFSKKTLVQKSLFPYGRGALGILLNWNLWKPFYWQISLQANLNSRETDSVQKMESNPVVTASFIYKNSGQNFFASYFQKNFFMEGQMQSLGVGSDLSFEINSWIFAFRGEFWSIKRTQPQHNLLTYYLFPSVSWGKISLGAFFGGAHHYLAKDQNHTLEYILKGDFYLTENLFLTIERIREQDSILKEVSWSFSLRTEFKI